MFYDAESSSWYVTIAHVPGEVARDSAELIFMVDVHL